MKRLDVGGFDAEVYDAENGDYVFHDEVQPMLRTLAQAVLEAHRCMMPGWSQERCLKDDGETCGHYLGQDASKCKHYGTCDC